MEHTLWIKIRARRKRRDFVFWTFILLCFLYMLSDLVFSDMGYLKYRELLGRRTALKARITETNKDNQQIQASLDEFSKDDFYKEKLARENFDLAKPGEYVFIFQNNGNGGDGKTPQK